MCQKCIITAGRQLIPPSKPTRCNSLPGPAGNNIFDICCMFRIPGMYGDTPGECGCTIGTPGLWNGEVGVGRSPEAGCVAGIPEI